MHGLIGLLSSILAVLFILTLVLKAGDPLIQTDLPDSSALHIFFAGEEHATIPGCILLVIRKGGQIQWVVSGTEQM